jgi:very-short-patch-repair endonuclease
VLSHRAAAGLHGLYRHSGLIDVTAPKPRSVAGIRCRRARGGLHPDDKTVIDGIPVTSIPRLCLDLAETLAPRQLQTILENLERRDLFDLHSFDALIARSPGRHGIKPLTQALENLRDDPPWTQSELEDAFLDLTRTAGLRTPLLNQFVDGILVDAFWPEHRLVVEVDGRTFHKTKRAVEDDQQRDIKLQIAGYRVVRFSHDRIMNHPHEVARDLRALLMGRKPASVRVISSLSANLDSSRERRSPR